MASSQRSASDTFDLFASGVLRRQPALRSLQLQPSGVIAQVYPPRSGAVGLGLACLGGSGKELPRLPG